MNKTCYIIGSGASIRKNQWDIPAIDLPIWKMLKNKATISLNWGYKFFDPMIELFVDYRFYATEINELKKLNLLISKDDAYYVREKETCEDILNKKLFLLKNADGFQISKKIGMQPHYWGKDS